MEARLQIEHPPLVAPALDFLDPAPVRFRHAQLNESERVIRKTGLAQAESFAPSRLEVGENLAINEFNQRFF